MKKALISVSNKEGIVAFAKSLELLDYEIISTGNTYKTLKENGVEVKSVEDYTDFPEMLGGRVKTLNPKIHAGILSKESHRDELDKVDYEFIDLVCVNLYPFKETLKNTSDKNMLVENIDIGGPTMLRGAAKNFERVTVVVDNHDFELVLSEIKLHGDTTLKTRQRLATKVFQHTAVYDALIAKTFNKWNDAPLNDDLILNYELKDTLRYGENPHQKGWVYEDETQQSEAMISCNQLHGKPLSYNNYNDGQAALDILSEFTEPCAVAVKHMNPCGVAIGENIDDAFNKAYNADPISIFGGIVALNREVTKNTALKLNDIFLEIVLAPSFSKEAFEILSRKKNIRLLEYVEKQDEDVQLITTHIPGGLLVQEIDVNEDIKSWECVSGSLNSKLENDMVFAQKIVKHVKSNAIILVKDLQTVGIGAGQMNRVGAAKIACDMAQNKTVGAVVGSDAFFPMRDTVDLLANYKVKAIVQPGGSIKDQESIDACHEHGLIMVLTKRRHFKH